MTKLQKKFDKSKLWIEDLLIEEILEFTETTKFERYAVAGTIVFSVFAIIFITYKIGV